MPTQKKPDFDQVSFLVGVDRREGPPVPIPNTEVKLTIAENTCRVTGRENRECRHEKSSPRLRAAFCRASIYEKGEGSAAFAFCLHLIAGRVLALPVPAVAAHVSQ